MATYTELQNLLGNGTALSPIRLKIRFAISVKAFAIATSAQPTAAQSAWAVEALRKPESYEDMCLRFIFSQFRDQTTTVITNATDTQVQDAVNGVVDTLLGVTR
jgi:hypothetical protein